MTRLMVAALVVSLSAPALAVEPGRIAPNEVAEASADPTAAAREAVDALRLTDAIDRFHQFVGTAFAIEPAPGSPDGDGAAPARAAIENVYRDEIAKRFREQRPVLEMMVARIVAEAFSPVELRAIVAAADGRSEGPGLDQELAGKLRSAERAIGEAFAAWWLAEMPRVLERADERLRHSGFAVQPGKDAR